MSFKDYTIIRNDRKNSIFGGGTAILIKRSINFEEIKLNSNATNKILETTAIQIKNQNKSKFNIISLHATNSIHKKEVITELNNVLN